MTNIDELVSHFAKTKLCVLIDDIGHNRSVLVAPAQEISEEEINYMLTITGGLTFVALSPERANAFLLSSMSRTSVSPSSGIAPTHFQFTSVEAREGVSTGISAADRAATIRILGASTPQPRSLVKPGHIFPVETKSGGVLVKAAIPEAALDITTLAGFSDAALFLDLLNKQGELLSTREATLFAEKNSLPLTKLSTLIQHRLEREPLIIRAAEALIPTKEAGEVKAILYRSTIHDLEHIALVKGALNTEQPVLVRVQSENTLADVFGGAHPASRDQLKNSLKAVGTRGTGVLLYLRRPLVGDNLHSAVENSHSSPERTATARMREYGVGAQILRDLGITQIELLSTTRRTLEGLSNFGISVVRHHPIPDYGAPLE